MAPRRELLRTEAEVEGQGAAPCGRLPAVASIAFLLSLLAAGSFSRFCIESATPRGNLVRAVTAPTPAEILERRLSQLTTGTQPAQEFELRMSTGHLHRGLGRYSRAAEHYAKARDLAQSSLGGGEKLGAALQALGQAHYQQGKLSDARRDLEGSLVLSGEGGELSAGTLQALGNVRRDSGEFSDAIQLYEQARRVAEERGDKERIPMLATELGEAYARRGDTDRAMAYFREALERKEAVEWRLHRTGATKDPEVALAQSLLGGVHHMRGDVKRAVELYQKAASIQAQTLRTAHPDAVATQVSIARAQRDLGEPAAAMGIVQMLEQALRKEKDNQEGPDLGRVLVLKADFLREAKRYEEAEIVSTEALERLRRTFGTDQNPEIAVTLMGYGSLLHDKGDLHGAREQYLRALDINLKTVGPKNPETAVSHNSLGTLYQDAGDEEQAKIHFTKCLEIQLESLGPANPDVSTSYNNLATVLFRQGRPQDAATLLQKALSVLDAAGVPPGSPDRAIYEENLAEAKQFLKDAESVTKVITTRARTGPEVV